METLETYTPEDQSETTVCIEDFCGTVGHGMTTSFWADYFTCSKVVKFGGEWCDVPNMPADTQPTTAQAYAWVKLQTGCDYGDGI